MESADRLCAIAETLAVCGSGNDLVVFGEIPGARSIDHGRSSFTPREALGSRLGPVCDGMPDGTA